MNKITQVTVTENTDTKQYDLLVYTPYDEEITDDDIIRVIAMGLAGAANIDKDALVEFIENHAGETEDKVYPTQEEMQEPSELDYTLDDVLGMLEKILDDMPSKK